MKVCIAYDSKYGNGKKCVEHLSKVIRAKGHDAELLSIREVSPKALPEANVYVFSTPTHVGTAPFKMKGFLKHLDLKQKKAKYSLMTTTMDPKGAKTLNKMTELIQPYGLIKINDGLMIKVKGMKGPLEEGYEKQIERFANTILSSK
jgi:flavodoxin